MKRSVPLRNDNDNGRSTRMSWFSPRLFALGVALGAIGAVLLLALNAYASTGTATRRGESTSTPTAQTQTPAPAPIFSLRSVAAFSR